MKYLIFYGSAQSQSCSESAEKLQNNSKNDGGEIERTLMSEDKNQENVQKSADEATVDDAQKTIMSPSEVIEATNARSSKKLLSNRQIASVIVEILKSNGGSLPIENIAEEFAKKTQIPLIMLVRIKLKVREN